MRVSSAPACLQAQTFEKLADSVQPFVDREELAGAVMLVADKDQVLTADAVGWADIAARKPMPAGGLFSTAHDVARFYQMLLSGGQLDGKRYLSESAVKQLTSRQTPPDLPQSYGFGLSVGDVSFGHGGAYSTNTTADTQHGLILVWLVQHAGFPGEGGKAQGIFEQAAKRR